MGIGATSLSRGTTQARGSREMSRTQGLERERRSRRHRTQPDYTLMSPEWPMTLLRHVQADVDKVMALRDRPGFI